VVRAKTGAFADVGRKHDRAVRIAAARDTAPAVAFAAATTRTTAVDLRGDRGDRGHRRRRVACSVLKPTHGVDQGAECVGVGAVVEVRGRARVGRDAPHVARHTLGRARDLGKQGAPLRAIIIAVLLAKPDFITQPRGPFIQLIDLILQVLCLNFEE
jgi:hypothetical protein